MRLLTIATTLTPNRIRRMVAFAFVVVRLVQFFAVALFGVFVPAPVVGVAVAVGALSAVAIAAFRVVLVVPALRFLSAPISHIYHIDRDQH